MTKLPRIAVTFDRETYSAIRTIAIKRGTTLSKTVSDLVLIALVLRKKKS